MKFSDWKGLSPEEAAREVLARVGAIAPVQRAAAIASLPSRQTLAARFAQAPRGRPLSGVPFFVKDLFDVAGEPTRAGSSFLGEVRPIPGRDAAIVRAFCEAGAVLAGKTHLHEFAYGLTGENPNFGDCEHPRFPGRTTGGSSSGSVFAVAAGLAPLAIGTDTGGSVRGPASFCGLYGFRKAPGDPWIADAFPLAPSFDTAGWFTANAEDMAASLNALLGPAARAMAPRGLYLEFGNLDPDVANAVRTAAEALAPAADRETAKRLREGFAAAPQTYAVIQSTEAFEVHKAWLDSHRPRYSPSVWARIDRGRRWTRDEIDSARSRCDAIRNLWAEYFRSWDFLVLPATPLPALTKAECALQEIRDRMLAITAPASLGGCPVLTIPVGLPSGLTTGLQVVVNDARSPAIGWALGLAGKWTLGGAA